MFTSLGFSAGCEGLSKNPPLDPPRVVVGLTRQRVAEHDVEHAEEADNGIESVFAAAVLAESVRNLDT